MTTLTHSQRKRAAILAAAIEMFAEAGFEQTNMDALAEAAEVSKRTIYKHFNSKDALFVAIVEDLKVRSRLAGTIEFDPRSPLRSQLIPFARRVINFHCDATSRRLGRVILSRILQRPEMAQELFGEGKLFEQDLRAWIRAAAGAERLLELSPKIASRQLLGLLETFIVWPQLIRATPEPTIAQRNRLAAESVDMFLIRYSKTPRT